MSGFPRKVFLGFALHVAWSALCAGAVWAEDCAIGDLAAGGDRREERIADALGCLSAKLDRLEKDNAIRQTGIASQADGEKSVGGTDPADAIAEEIRALRTTLLTLGRQVDRNTGDIERLNDSVRVMQQDQTDPAAQELRLSSNFSPYSVLAQIQAQAACVGLVGPGGQIVTAAARPAKNVAGMPVSSDENKGYMTCNDVCRVIHGFRASTSQCVGSVHIYNRGFIDETGAPFLAQGSSDVNSRYYGLRTYVYKPEACSTEGFGPNYCCCQAGG